MLSERKCGFNDKRDYSKDFGVVNDERWIEPYNLFSKFSTPNSMNGNARFVRFNVYKFYRADYQCWVSEEEFFKRYNSRRPLKREDIYKRYIEKYKTVLNLLCVSFNGKDIFWQNIKRDFDNDRVDCYEVRLEETINTCTSTTRKYWRTHRNVAARRRRTELFE
jgi:hypothetical protein